MNITVVGTGYVGLVSAACFAESGHRVVGLDVDEEKIRALKHGTIPIYEPGLAELTQRNIEAGRLSFSTEYRASVNQAEVIFLAVGTPQAADGQADLRYLWNAVQGICEIADHPLTVVIKSTVPVGTNAAVHAYLASHCSYPVDVVSNPEFLKEGAAIEDFMKPDRVVVGVRENRPAELLRGLYAPFLRTERPFLVMSPESAEMTKYVANCMLATKISFINEMANLCEQLGADIDDVRRGIGHDARIGFSFLFPGPGWGGSCFPKDIQAMMHQAGLCASPVAVLEAVYRVNERQKRVLPEKIVTFFGGDLKGKTIAVWGLAFKPRTDDIRESPALCLIDQLLEARAQVCVHDPAAMANVAAIYGDRLTYCTDQYEALDGTDALAIVTEWQQYRQPDFAKMQSKMRGWAIFDARNLYDPKAVQQLGFDYFSIGRPAVTHRNRAAA